MSEGEVKISIKSDEEFICSTILHISNIINDKNAVKWYDMFAAKAMPAGSIQMQVKYDPPTLPDTQQ